jgi:uncharacterized membrane protein (UPF0182 family)
VDRPVLAAPSAPAPGDATPAGRARRHYEALQEAASAGDWQRFGRELDGLGEALRQLED